MFTLMDLPRYLFRLLSVFQILQNKTHEISPTISIALPFPKKEINQFDKATQTNHLSIPRLASFKKDLAVFVSLFLLSFAFTESTFNFQKMPEGE